MMKVIQCTIPGPMGLESFNMKFKTKREAILVEQGGSAVSSNNKKKFLQRREGGIRSSAPTQSLEKLCQCRACLMITTSPNGKESSTHVF